MSHEARSYTRDRLRVLETIDGKAETDRLWRNLLSSQPMAFSIAGHLHAHFPEAAALLSALTEMPIARLVGSRRTPKAWPAYALDGIDAEWFPPRSAHTGDMSGCDIGACLELTDGRRVLVTVEVKYTDTFSAKPVAWDRYEEHLTALGLDEVKTAALVEAGCSQVLRQVMVSDSTRRQGLAPGAGLSVSVDEAVAVVLAREDDTVAREVTETLDLAVGDIVPVRFWSHRRLIDEAAKIRGYRSGRATWLSATSETDLARLRRQGRASALPHRIRLFRSTDTSRKDAHALAPTLPTDPSWGGRCAYRCGDSSRLKLWRCRHGTSS